MQTFNTAGKTFEIGLKLSTVRKLRSVIGLDLLNSNSEIKDRPGESPLTVLYGDVEKLIEVLLALVRDQLVQYQMNDDEFVDSLDISFADARKAFFAEWVDFFTQAGLTAQAELLRIGLEELQDAPAKMRQAVKLAVAQAAAQANEVKLVGNPDLSR